MSIRAGILGVSGYTGGVLYGLLSDHPEVRLGAVAGRRSAGKRLSEVWPGLSGWDDREVVPAEPERFEGYDVVFLALPHSTSGALAPRLLAGGALVIDLGADFRLKDPAVWRRTYGSEHPAPELLAQAVYGLPEVNRRALAGARLVATPGCYPTATALAALPLAEGELTDWIVADCISGVSGAGRDPGPRNLYCEVQESASAYGLAGGHRHGVEMEQLLGLPVTFTPHLAPLRRGMLATVHARLKAPMSAAELRARYTERYAGCPAVALRGGPPATGEVLGSARAHVHVAVDEARGVATAVCAIDNLMKGAASQAVQCMNLALGLPELTGLPGRPQIP